MALSLDDAREFLPKYLSPTDRAELFSELQRLPDGLRYYATIAEPEPFQGDGWEHVDYVDVLKIERRTLRVLVLSNTCDIDSNNKRLMVPNVTLSPLIRVDRFCDLLRRHGIAEATIQDKLSDIRRQEVTSVFHLPRGGPLDSEHLVLFDDVQSQSLSVFSGNAAKTRIFSLSQSAHWLFLLKLSIHFCRSNEGVARGYA